MNLRDFNGSAPYRVITSQRLTCPASTSTPSAAFNSSTVAMANGNSDLGICFKFGSDPTASLSDPILPHMVINSNIGAGGSGYLTFKVTPGDKVAFRPSGNSGGINEAEQKVVIIELGY